ncbi:DNA ligase-like protein [Zostera marina]|uniref:DNA ligase-like protein n=1 Tax=Zostera marina TaxID=29655 RepID=A0A0K9NPS5_ZOSMR|nr:DNA ligase-like protein [Zostera marina]
MASSSSSSSSSSSHLRSEGNNISSDGCNGVCMINITWRDEQKHSSLIRFISSFLDANSYRLKFLSIAPDFIFNNGGISVAFNFVTSWDPAKIPQFFSRVDKIKRQFKNFYVVVCLPAREQNDSFNRNFFKYGLGIGNPSIVPVLDPEMGFEKIVKIALARGVIKTEDIAFKMKVEREREMQSIDAFIRVITSIPGIDAHDANALIQSVGSIEAIAKASENFILQNTDLSKDKAEHIFRFFRDPEYYLRPKIN